MIRVILPTHLQTLAHVDGEVQLHVEGQVTQRAVLDMMQTREELYAVLDYHAYERKLDELFAQSARKRKRKRRG